MNLVVSDLTYLHIDEVGPIAKYFDLEEIYSSLIKADKIDYKITKKYMKLLKGYGVNELKCKINEAKPFPGSKESINIFRKNGYKFVIITGNPLLSISANKEIIQSKLNVDEIYTTCYAVVSNNKYTGELTEYKPKSEIVKGIFERYNVKRLIGMVQGRNDYELAKAIKKFKGHVFIINSNCKKLKEIGDYEIPSINEAPKIIQDFLKKL